MCQQKAFTLVELVMVLAILGVCSAVAVPKFIDIKTEEQVSNADGVFGAAQSAAAINHAAKLVGKTVADRPAYDATSCPGGMVTNGACLMAALDGAPDGWSSTGNTISATLGGTTYRVSVAIAETGTGKAILRKSW